MRNLNRITNYFNKLEAWRDWRAVYYQAICYGLAEQADQLYPKDDDSWRRIDKQTAKLREIIERHLYTQIGASIAARQENERRSDIDEP